MSTISINNKEIVISVYKRKYINLHYSIKFDDGLIPHIESVDEIVEFFYEIIAVGFHSVSSFNPNIDLTGIYIDSYLVTTYSDIPPEDLELIGVDIEVLNNFLEVIINIIEDFLRFYENGSYYQLSIVHLDLYKKILSFKITEIGENEIEEICYL